MRVDEYGYFEQRAGAEPGCAEVARNRYVQPCHQRLAERYQRAAARSAPCPTTGRSTG